MSDRYQIFCPVCGDDVFLIPVGEDYQCSGCLGIYSNEDGVVDLLVAEDMYKLYQGAKLAGLIRDPEWAEYDREHPYER